jgi:hypothetical protein
MVDNPERKMQFSYESKIDPDDDLEDAKIHVRHAEDRIHALRKRLKHHSPLNSESRKVSSFNYSAQLPMETNVQRMKTRIAQLEAMIKDRNEVNLAYQEQLAILAGKTGVITGLRLGTDELRIQVSDAAGQLMESQEKTQNLKNQVELMAEGAKEMQKLQEEIVILQNTVSSKEEANVTQNSLGEAQLSQLAEIDAELVKLKQESEELSFKMSDMTTKKDGELTRIRAEKQALHDELVVNGADITKVRNENEKLRKEFESRVQHADALQVQLAEKDGEIATLQLQRKSLQEQVVELDAQRRLVDQFNSDLLERNEELERKKKQNNQLLESTKILNQDVVSEKSRAEQKEREYHDLEKKLLDFQNTLTGNTDKEKSLLEQLKKLEREAQDTNRKYQSELVLDDELERENESLTQKLRELEASSQQEGKDLRSRLDVKVQLERKISEENIRIENELQEKLAESSQNEKIYIEMKKKYDEEKAIRKVRKVDYKKAEQEMQEKIALLEKDAAEKDRRLAAAKEIEEQRAKELEENEQHIALYGMQLKKKDEEMIELRNKLAKIQNGNFNSEEETTLKQRAEIEKLEATLTSLQLKAEENIRAEEYVRSQLDAQNRLMQSRQEMVKARNQKINMLQEATRGDDPVEVEDSRFLGIHVTSVIDHRANDGKPMYYKHKNNLTDYHDHILRVDESPKFILESELETIRRKMLADEAKKRKRHNRRPSLS